MKVIGALKSRAQPDPSLVLYRDRPQTPINGVGRLPAAMTINSVTEYPVFRYTAGAGLVDAADWRPWGYGENLDIVAVATPPTLLAGSPGLGPMDQSVLFAASDYFQAANNDFADITTEDIVAELVVRFDTSNGARVLSKYVAAGYIIGESTDKMRFYIDAGVPNATVLTDTLTNYMWYHMICFIDRSGYGQWYVNGAASGAAVDVSAVAGSMTVATPFDLCSLGSFGLAYAALWKGAGWLDTHLQATLAEQRASLFWGWMPQQARGTAVPTVRTRASNAYLDRMHYDGTRRLYLVGNNVPRAVERVDKNGATLKGYLSEVQITNLCLHSEDISAGFLTLVGTTITNTTTTTAPNGVVTNLNVVHEDTSNGNHRISQGSINSGGATGRYVASGWFKEINRPLIFVRITAGINYDCYFNLSTGEYTIPGGASTIEAGMEKWGNGWWRCWLSLNRTTTASMQYQVYGAESIGDLSWLGLDQDIFYCWGVQLEAGVDYPTSYMPTAAAAVIREEDVLRYKGDDGNLGGVGSNKRGEIRFKLLLPDVDFSATANHLALTDGGASGNRVLVNSDPGVDFLRVYTNATGESAGVVSSTTDVFSDVIKKVSVPYKDNALRIKIDGAQEGSTDTDCGMPDDLDRIDVGCSPAGAVQSSGPLADIEFYPRESRD